MRKVKFFQIDVGEEEAEAVRQAVVDGWISGSGPSVKLFEKEFARKMQVKHAIAVCNGTCSLIASLLAFKKRIGNLKVAVPTWTYLATVASTRLLGKYKLMDSKISTFNMKAEVPKNVNLIMPVDVGGMPIDYEAFSHLNKPILADSAEAVGATYVGKPLGGIANIHCFSFHAAKIITTGEGGMITTDDDGLNEDIRLIINQGYKASVKREYIHDSFGLNFRMTEMQAAIGRVQLRKLDRNIVHRRKIARIYRDVIDKVGFQSESPRTKSSYFLFTILVNPKVRDKLADYLMVNGVETKIWRPVHRQKPFLSNRKFPNADYIYQRHLHLPINNFIREEDAKYIGDLIRKKLS